MDNFPLKIDITVANLQYIINVLAARPYSEVALILPALKQQAEAQIAAANAPPPRELPDPEPLRNAAD